MAKEDPSPPPASSPVSKGPRNQPAAEGAADDGSPLAGYIFMCSGATRPECFSYRVMGLPRGRMDTVSRIRRGAALFLYDFTAKYLYGPYRADSDGGLALEPAAFQWRYPAQVKFAIDGDFMPIPESSVRSAINENYSCGKFWPELTSAQVEKLRTLFHPITVMPEAPPPHYVDNRHPAPSAAYLPPSASYTTQPAAYVHHPGAYVSTPAAHLVPNEPYARPDSHLPAQYTVPAYYATTTGHRYQAAYEAYGPSPATYPYAQAPPLQFGYAQAQYPVAQHVTDPAYSSDPYYAANRSDPYRYDAVKSHYQENTSGSRAAYGAPHEAAVTNLQLVRPEAATMNLELVRSYGSVPSGAAEGAPRSNADGAAPAAYSYAGAPVTTQAENAAVTLVYVCPALAPFLPTGQVESLPVPSISAPLPLSLRRLCRPA